MRSVPDFIPELVIPFNIMQLVVLVLHEAVCDYGKWLAQLLLQRACKREWNDKAIIRVSFKPQQKWSRMNTILDMSTSSTDRYRVTTVWEREWPWQTVYTRQWSQKSGYTTSDSRHMRQTDIPDVIIVLCLTKYQSKCITCVAFGQWVKQGVVNIQLVYGRRWASWILLQRHSQFTITKMPAMSKGQKTASPDT